MKTEMKHTKGKWELNADDRCIINLPNDISIEVIHWATEHEEATADAQLIAATPELLKALIEIEEAAMALADAAPSDYKNKRDDLFADIHNAHLHSIEAIKKAIE